MKIGKIDEAEKWYKEALKVKVDHLPAHLTMAKLMHKKVQCSGIYQCLRLA